MRGRILLTSGSACALLVLAAPWIIPAEKVADDVRADAQLHAMTDELARARTLQLSTLDKPYFIEYSSSDAQQTNIAASLGGITSSNCVHLRHPRAQVRVGGYDFDNTNFVYTGNPQIGWFPVDDDYQAMRTTLWLSTDSLYKASTDQITRKRAVLRDMADRDKTPDFAPAKPVHAVQPVSQPKFDAKQWEDVVRRLSAGFVSHPSIIDSDVRMSVVESTFRYVNSEGTILRVPQNLSEIEIVAAGIAADGTRVRNQKLITVLQTAEMPKEEQLTRIVESIAEETEALTKAPMAEDYTGPVLFEQEAAPEMMAQMLTDAVRLRRKPLAPPDRQHAGSEMVESVWSARMGTKVAPDWLTILDNPREERFNGAALAGTYQVDDEGVPAERVMLVDKGVLKGFLLSRQPVRNFNISNGHGRLEGGFGGEQADIGNIFALADRTVPESKIRSRLTEKVKSAGLKYGIAIRRLDFPSTATFQELQGMARQLQNSGYSRTLNAPLLAYRIYPDGREELVRGMRFREFSAKDLRDLDAASDRSYVLNYVNNGSSFDLVNASSNAITSAVVCPSLLFDSVDIGRAEYEQRTPPIVPPPSLVAQ